MPGVKGRSGRPRLTAEEHRLRGSYRADRHGPLPPIEEPPLREPEPNDFPDEAIQPPRDLNKMERAQWAYFALLLASARVLTPADRGTLADYCRASVAVNDRQRRLTRAFRKRTIDKQTVRMLDSQLRAWIGEKTRLATELGLTALSRARLKWTGHQQQRPSATPTPTKPLSKLAQLQERAVALRHPVGVK